MICVTPVFIGENSPMGAKALAQNSHFPASLPEVSTGLLNTAKTWQSIKKATCAHVLGSGFSRREADPVKLSEQRYIRLEPKPRAEAKHWQWRAVTGKREVFELCSFLSGCRFSCVWAQAVRVVCYCLDKLGRRSLRV